MQKPEGEASRLEDRPLCPFGGTLLREAAVAVLAPGGPDQLMEGR
jgi:hypothetical protein